MIASYKYVDYNLCKYINDYDSKKSHACNNNGNLFYVYSQGENAEKVWQELTSKFRLR